jgi:hypothetical protein
MWWFKLVYAQGSYASLAQLVQGCTTYCSQANDYHIEIRSIHSAILLQKANERKGEKDLIKGSTNNFDP